MNMYEVIGNKIQSSLNLIAGDVVVWLSLDGMSVTTLYRIDDGYGQWEDDWYEGQKDVQLIDYCLLDDLKPVAHAHWIKSFFPGSVEFGLPILLDAACSNCGEHQSYEAFPFCPYCQAIMDEEVDK